MKINLVARICTCDKCSRGRVQATVEGRVTCTFNWADIRDLEDDTGVCRSTRDIAHVAFSRNVDLSDIPVGGGRNSREEQNNENGELDHFVAKSCGARRNVGWESDQALG